MAHEAWLRFTAPLDPDLGMPQRSELRLAGNVAFSTLSNTQDKFLTMSDDDAGSIVTNPFERDILTDEVLAHYEKIHRENPHPAYWGPPLRSPRATPPPQRKPRLLDGIGPIRYLEGLRRLPNGRVYSQRLEVQRPSKAAEAPTTTTNR